MSWVACEIHFCQIRLLYDGSLHQILPKRQQFRLGKLAADLCKVVRISFSTADIQISTAPSMTTGVAKSKASPCTISTMYKGPITNVPS